MGNVSAETIEQLQIGYRDVVSVDPDLAVIQAFVKMVETRKSGIAVVQANEFDEMALIGNVSASDLKDIGYDGQLFSKLYIPVSTFLEMKTKYAAVPPPLTVSPQESISHVLEQFHQHGIHRLYIVDTENDTSLLGVITPSDVLRLFASHR